MSLPGDSRYYYLLTVGQRRVQRWIRDNSGEDGLTAQQAGVLVYLERHDGSLIGDVAQALDSLPSAMTGLADRMVEAGWIERRQDKGDGRLWRLYLTTAGREAGGRARIGLAELNKRLTDGFSNDEMAVVSRWLKSVGDRFG